ncbi:flap endonuclease GEN homolog 1-like isoform X2 [Pomacea canaliculata]|nr:flap endonuclease GEN homolog 1-like isoform X2 [Pomacea canaliculata]XP_025088226.1 flap endonuclease GEN homolog 1-like isoform X2 [Pomacea canaliculata]
MGVTGLWSVLEPVKHRISLKDLQGQTLAVDLSIWVCENQSVRQMQHKVKKPHLRNLFFRVWSLLKLGVRLVFIIEGEAPLLKQQEMKKRLQNRNPASQKASSSHKCSRSSFQILLKECCQLLNALGVPYIQSQGEAERLCAALSAAGIVDGCISDDSDCFLYGARKVYKDLSTDARDPHVESYSMTDIETQLNLTRDKLVALALVTGCDYFPAGIPGVGEAWTLKLLSSLGEMDILARFHKWREMTREECISNAEVFVWQRAIKLPDFPPKNVIEEFLVFKERTPLSVPCWRRPNIEAMMAVGRKYLDWPLTYVVEKTLPLITLWDLLDLSCSSHSSSHHLQPLRILKKRTRQHTACLEVEWCNDKGGLVNESGQLLQLVTIEEQILFEKVFPDMVSQFLQPAEKSKSKKKHGTQKMKEELKQTESLMTFFKNLAICSDESGVSTESLEHQTSPQSKAEKEEAETAPLSQRLMSKLSKTDSSVQSHTASPAASLPQLDALCADRCSYMSDGQFDLQFSFTLTDCSLVAPNHLNLTTQSSSLFDSPIPEKNQAVDLDSSHISIFSSEESVWEKEVISTCSQKSATQHVFYPASANDSFCKRQEKLSGFDSPKHEFPPCKPIHILHSDDLCVSASATNNSTTSMPNSLGKEKTQNNTPMIVEEPRKKPEHCDEHLPLFQRLRQRLPKETQNELAKLTSFENLDTKAFHF